MNLSAYALFNRSIYSYWCYICNHTIYAINCYHFYQVNRINALFVIASLSFVKPHFHLSSLSFIFLNLSCYHFYQVNRITFCFLLPLFNLSSLSFICLNLTFICLSLLLISSKSKKNVMFFFFGYNCFSSLSI